MDDTSYAIHPGNEQNMMDTSFKDVGRVIDQHLDGQQFFITCENVYITLTFVRDDILRVTMDPEKWPEMKTTSAIIRQPENIDIHETKETDHSIIESELLHVEVTYNPCRLNIQDKTGRVLSKESARGMGYKKNGEVIAYKMRAENDRFYGFGEKTGYLDKRGEKLTMWNTDVYAPHNPETDPLYQSIPFFITFRQGHACGTFFDNSGKTTFDIKSEEETYHFHAESGVLDYYMFAGPTMKDVLQQYTWLTGTMPLPPKWALGYHQSRYSYESEEEVRQLVNNFIDKDIPLDAVYLDIHYMNEYRVFSFDEDRFPNPKQLVKDLKTEGIRIVTIVDPGVKVDPEYEIYQEGVREGHFCKYLEGNHYVGDVWPGPSAFPDFTNEKARWWWGNKHQFYSDLGIEGIWNDMNEPAVFNESKTMDINVMHDNDGDPKTHRELHNLYGMLMGQSTYEGMKKHLNGRRPFLLTRAGYAGVQRYAAVWTGDNRSFWEHLQLAIPMCLNLGLSGVPLSGADVGGFAYDANGELFARWMQFGAFAPYFRNHSAIGTDRQEPWAFGKEIEEIAKTYIDLRYQWLPEWYRLFKEASETGVPAMRPLILEYPDDENTYQLYDQFMLGDHTIIAPVMQPESQHRVVYLPEGRWVHYWNGETYEGRKHHLVSAPLDTLPLFIREGAIIVHGPKKRSTAYKDEELTLYAYLSESGKASGEIYDDDGETSDHKKGEYLQYQVSVRRDGQDIYLDVDKQVTNFSPQWTRIQLVIHGIGHVENVLVNGEKLKDKNMNVSSTQVALQIPL
ncbi:glycoside hydrolase family 31 protein [Texcoconibacillus texcoconensis]|uniref:Alpha-glucosidase n=1 Tax=Texcoconibacillus texcoconensis TaxID=1095777 RepID=A0A840QSP6_9BACI|nr:glycoside hydrolase family 31 protein [Texcoconibacillus texcoconensis]MBB5174339.1 alpha-glucosidase [Texcoconibacillus texcoconensis]